MKKKDKYIQFFYHLTEMLKISQELDKYDLQIIKENANIAISKSNIEEIEKRARIQK